MIKIILSVLGIAALLFVAYVAWVVSQASKSMDRSIDVQTELGELKVTVTATLTGTDSEYAITQVLFPRDIGEAAGVSAPDGFVETPYTLSDTGDDDVTARQAWVDNENADWFRWTGSIPLRPGAPTVVEMAVERPVTGVGRMTFQYERRIGIGGEISHFYAPFDGRPESDAP